TGAGSGIGRATAIMLAISPTAELGLPLLLRRDPPRGRVGPGDVPWVRYIVEFPIRVRRAGVRFTEIPSPQRRRAAGRSKVNAFGMTETAPVGVLTPARGHFGWGMSERMT